MFLRIVALLLMSITLGCRATAPDVPFAHSQQHPGVTTNENQVQQATFLQEVRWELDSIDGNDSKPDDRGDEFSGKTGQENQKRAVSSGTDVPQAMLDSPVAKLDELIIAAFTVNPAIRKLEAQIEALNGKHCQAGLLPNPTIGINGSDINEGGSPGRYGVYYGNTIVRGNKLRLSQNIVSNEIRQAQFELTELQQRLSTDVELRYYSVLVAIKKFNLAAQLVALSRDAVEATSQLLEAKEIAATALIQAELELQNALVQQQRAQNDMTAARRKLATLIGEVDLPYDSFSGSLEEPDTMEIESQFDRILQNSPEIAKMYAGVDLARSKLARQCVQPIGNVSWQTSIAYDFGSDDLVSGFQVGLPIPKFNRNQGAICQARNEVLAAEHDIERRTLRLRQQLVEAFRQYRDAKMQVVSFESEILPRARESLELITAGFQQGEVDFLQLLTAQRTYFQFNLAVIQQQNIMWQQRINIEGLLLSGNLETR